jgi:hypothetical protein
MICTLPKKNSKKKNFKRILQHNRYENGSSPRLELLLRILSVTPNAEYNSLMNGFKKSILEPEISEKKAWACVTYAALDGDASEIMQQGLKNLISTVQNEGFKEVICSNLHILKFIATYHRVIRLFTSTVVLG